jgi:hypothetical protein
MLSLFELTFIRADESSRFYFICPYQELWSTVEKFQAQVVDLADHDDLELRLLGRLVFSTKLDSTRKVVENDADRSAKSSAEDEASDSLQNVIPFGPGSELLTEVVEGGNHEDFFLKVPDIVIFASDRIDMER